MPLVVRRAVPGDAAGVAFVHVRAWQETYRHLVPTDLLDALNPADREDRWREIIEGADEDAWVAERDRSIVGWITTAVRDEAEHPRALELNGIYALASEHGTGVGQSLHDAAIGDAPAFLWSAADNPRAQAFYRRNGFAPDGATAEYPMLQTMVSIERWVR